MVRSIGSQLYSNELGLGYCLSWNYADILWNGIRADAVQAAFDILSRKEKFFLENRNAICMNCGRVMPWDERYSFEQLATAYEYSTTSGAERAYKGN